MGAIAVSVTFLVMALTATVVLLVALLSPDNPDGPSPLVERTGVIGIDGGVGGDGGDGDRSARQRLRLLSRALFARRSFDAITLDCTLVRAEGAIPKQFEPPSGLPFTLRLRVPDTSWFASRVEELLIQWAEDSREIVVELREDKGKVRTSIASGDSSVHLELVGSSPSVL
jgi:hypothetical protein